MGSRLEKNSDAVRKRIQGHAFNDEEGEEYEASTFGGFGDYMRRKKLKLQNLDAEIRAQSGQNPPIFRGVVAHVNGYTQPSLSDLHTLIVSHGGGFLQYLEGKTAVTHVIASQLTPKKKVEFARYRIVKPAWVVDSIAAGRMLPWNEYRVVDEGVTQKVLGFENGSIVSQANTQRKGYIEQTETSWYTSQLRNETPNKVTEEAANEPNEVPPSGKQGNPAPRLTVDGTDDLGELFEDEDLSEQAFGVEHDFDVEGEYEECDDGELMKPAVLSDRPPSPVSLKSAIDEQSDNLPKSVQKKPLTAEEHNAILLQNPHMAKSSTANPDFINQYYRESRLHHLSTWKADLKAQLQARAQEKSSAQKARNKLTPGSRRYILHIDFDSFFAAVSLRQNPHLVDKPVVIAHGSGPGSEIASCNYPARSFGVKNGMWMKTALQLCSELNVLPYDFKAYEEASRHFYDSILAIDGIVQSISIDEALIDVSEQCIKAGGSDGRAISEGSIYREQEKAQQIAQSIRDAVREKTECEVSVGMGNNILLAKVALRKAKPAGQHLIKPDDVLAFLGELEVTTLPGVAWSIGKKLEEIGVKYVKDIRELNKERLVLTLGPKTGQKLWDYSRGIDKQEVGEQVIRKSVSAEINWGIRFINQQQAEDFVQCLCDELSKRLLENLVKGKQMTMKIMRKAADAGMDPPKNLGHGKCDTFNKSVVLGVATTDKAVLGKEAISILRSYGFSPGELRGLGVQMQKLEPLKPALSGMSAVESSQRRLQFKKPAAMTAKAPNKQVTDDDATSRPQEQSRPRLTDQSDPIEEISTPKKNKSAHVIEGAIAANMDMTGKQRPLNLAGTQFIMPSQVDPAVLAELPADIRAKFAPKQKSIFDSIKRSDSPSNDHKSRSASPQISDHEFVPPSHSQIDPSILAELPEDVRQEVLQQHQQQHASRALPLSPMKPAPAAYSKKLSTPPKKQKFLATTKKGRGKKSSLSSLTQANFVSKIRAPEDDANETRDTEAVSESFLAELPEEIRQEILDDQRRKRMQAKGGLNLGSIRRKAKAPAPDTTSKGQQTLSLPAQPAKPTFTSRRLSTVKELQDAMVAWVTSFSGDGESGPYDDDIEALGAYLNKVVTDERDMEKAATVVQWLAQVIDMQDFGEEDHIKSAWDSALRKLQCTVQEAVAYRNLAPLDLDSG